MFYIGVLQLTVVFLSIFAGIIVFRLLKISGKHKTLGAWRVLIIVLILFAIEEIIGILDAFDIYRQINYWRHIVPSLILGFLIIAIMRQIHITRR